MALISSAPRPAASAYAEPDIPAKIMLATTLTWARPAFRCPKMESAKLNIRAANSGPFHERAGENEERNREQREAGETDRQSFRNYDERHRSLENDESECSQQHRKRYRAFEQQEDEEDQEEGGKHHVATLSFLNMSAMSSMTKYTEDTNMEREPTIADRV